ncbi:hypothetical protein [Pinirhizobacter soli]|uniref:hypothetical protein n=1 Tax=Pinirhizobacter soli TaxID=2786953 RepID=UPI00202AADAB|nr:hypothetical protein [Pinirhizobacter soli]
MDFTIEQDPARDSLGNYRYRIYKDGALVARYWHDFRGDEHGIEFVTGKSDSWPVGRMTDFLEGGGPEPLTLSERAVAYMDQRT